MSEAIRAVRDKKGMTLIEMMVALCIFSIVGIALTKMTLLSMRTNLQNAIRDEAVLVASERMDTFRALPLTASELSNTGGLLAADGIVTRTIRNGSVQFTRTRSIANITSGSYIGAKLITVVVSWTLQGHTYSTGRQSILK
jgi:prepilin-type N-terminal cleavage/methylation domain-containing protein